MVVDCVFEIRNTSCEEFHRSMGVFPSLYSAMQAISDKEDPAQRLSDDFGFGEDVEVISIYDRSFGLVGDGRQVLEIRRERVINDDGVETWSRV